jgi:hypothetical protein
VPATRPSVHPAAALWALLSVAGAILSVALVAGPAGAVAPTPTPTPTPPDWVDEAVRSRYVACSAAVKDHSTGAAAEVIDEHLSCIVQMTDPMAGGELSADLAVTFEPASAAAGTWEGTFRIARSDGTWIGVGHGAAASSPGGGAPAIYGQVDYRGSGDCAGLSYRQLLAGESAPSALSGWIDGPRPEAPFSRLAHLPTLWVDRITLGALVP